MRVGIIQELSENSQKTKDGGEAGEETNSDAGRDRSCKNGLKTGL